MSIGYLFGLFYCWPDFLQCVCLFQWNGQQKCIQRYHVVRVVFSECRHISCCFPQRIEQLNIDTRRKMGWLDKQIVWMILSHHLFPCSCFVVNVPNSSIRAREDIIFKLNVWLYCCNNAFDKQKKNLICSLSVLLITAANNFLHLVTFTKTFVCTLSPYYDIHHCKIIFWNAIVLKHLLPGHLSIRHMFSSTHRNEFNKKGRKKGRKHKNQIYYFIKV